MRSGIRTARYNLYYDRIHNIQVRDASCNYFSDLLMKYKELDLLSQPSASIHR